MSPINNSLFIGDNSGTIYQLSLSGQIINKLNIGSTVLTEISLYNNNIYTIALDGYLYRIDLKTNNIIKVIKVDDNIEIDDYLIKSQLVYNKSLYIANSIGELFVINLENNSLLKKISAGKDKITTPVYHFNGYYYFGNATGDIFFME